MEHKERLSSTEITGENRSSISSSIMGLEVENRFWKWSVKIPPISAHEETQSPALDLRKLMALDLLLMSVELWKYLVLRSLQVSQVSLDFDLHKDSSCLSKKSNSNFS
jgi:hypothetical protein